MSNLKRSRSFSAPRLASPLDPLKSLCCSFVLYCLRISYLFSSVYFLTVAYTRVAKTEVIFGYKGGVHTLSSPQPTSPLTSLCCWFELLFTYILFVTPSCAVLSCLLMTVTYTWMEIEVIFGYKGAVLVLSPFYCWLVLLFTYIQSVTPPCAVLPCLPPDCHLFLFVPHANTRSPWCFAFSFFLSFSYLPKLL